jgi:methylthioxylose transferase
VATGQSYRLEPPAEAGPGARPAAHVAVVAAAYIVLVAGTHWWGNTLAARGVRLGLEFPPLFGRLDPQLTWRVLPAIVVAVLVVAFSGWLSTSLPWRSLLAASWLGAAAWAVALAFTGGWDALASPVLSRHDAPALLPQVGGILQFLANFTDRIASYPVHVQGHPPGLVVLLAALDRIGLAAPGVIAGLYIAAGAAVAPAVAVAARSVAGEDRARAAIPFLVLAPYAVWIATSADALYAGVAAWGVALIISAPADRWWQPGAGGVLFGLALFLTSGAAGLVLLPVTVLLLRRSVAPLLWAAAGAALVTAAFALAGFWWFDGLAATRERYYAGLGGLRPYGYFVIANLAALAVAAGPATLAGMSSPGARRSLRTRPSLGWLVLAAALAVAAANLSGLSKGEVERIWLLFTPWLVAAAAFIPGTALRRWWLAAGALLALAVQVLVVTPW